MAGGLFRISERRNFQGNFGVFTQPAVSGARQNILIYWMLPNYMILWIVLQYHFLEDLPHSDWKQNNWNWRAKKAYLVNVYLVDLLERCIKREIDRGGCFAFWRMVLQGNLHLLSFFQMGVLNMYWMWRLYSSPSMHVFKNYICFFNTKSFNRFWQCSSILAVLLVFTCYFVLRCKNVVFWRHVVMMYLWRAGIWPSESVWTCQWTETPIPHPSSPSPSSSSSSSSSMKMLNYSLTVKILWAHTKESANIALTAKKAFT